MTTTTENPVAAAAIEARRFPRARVLVAFLVGMLVVALAAVGSVLAYEQAYAGKVAAGVSVGGVQLSGLTRSEASARLEAAFASVGTGQLTITTQAGPVTLTYAELGRKPDVDGMLAAAFAVGRTGNGLERVVDEARTAIGRLDVKPLVVLDQAVLESRIAAIAAKTNLDPVSASVATGPAGFTDDAATWGRKVDQAATVALIAPVLDSTAAPAALTVPLVVDAVSPSVTDVDTMIARSRAGRMVAPVILVHGKDRWTIDAKTVGSWISFGSWADGSYGPLVDPTAVQKAVATLAKKIDKPAVPATFLVSKGGKAVGVKASKDGRTLDAAGTADAVRALLVARAAAGTDPSAPVTPAVTVVKPSLTTEEAAKAAPLMRAISTWTTYYAPGPHNGNSANISLPAMAIDGTVLAPGQWFSFWKVVGEVSLAKGYKLGGAIINGHSVEGKSIGGGICSCSTTIFNAAVRAGLQMGARKNHYYYISRYPKGLDATVFKSDGGGTQDMTFRNDTPYPILIRAYARPGVVRFTLFSVPTGRKVSFTKPIVKNYRPGFTTREYTTSLRPGVVRQVEYAADGQDVWVTRTVTDASGKVLHKDTWYSHYARMIGVVLVGRAK